MSSQRDVIMKSELIVEYMKRICAMASISRVSKIEMSVVVGRIWVDRVVMKAPPW